MQKLYAKLKRHMAGPRPLSHEVSTFILVIVKQCVSFINSQHFHISLSLLRALFG